MHNYRHKLKLLPFFNEIIFFSQFFFQNVALFFLYKTYFSDHKKVKSSIFYELLKWTEIIFFDKFFL